jgi:NTE family protein
MSDVSETSKKEHLITNLVLSGGGVKGIVMLGALKALEDNGFLDNIKSISMTSVGSLIGALYVMGYKIDDIYEFLSILDISKMKSLQPGRLFTQFGLDDGKKLLMVVEKLLEAKNISPNITLSELYEKTNINLYITGSCLNDKKTYYFSHLSYPNMLLKTAIRISTSVPLWFTPVEHDGKIYVDGGCMENYPMSIFKDDLDSTIGVHLTSEKPCVNSIDNLESFLINLTQCFEEGSELKAVCGYEKNTIQLNPLNMSPFNLNISNNVKQEMFDFGYQTAMKSHLISSKSSNII